MARVWGTENCFLQPEFQKEDIERQSQKSRKGSKCKMTTARTPGMVLSVNLQCPWEILRVGKAVRFWAWVGQKGELLYICSFSGCFNRLALQSTAASWLSAHVCFASSSSWWASIMHQSCVFCLPLHLPTPPSLCMLALSFNPLVLGHISGEMARNSLLQRAIIRMVVATGQIAEYKSVTQMYRQWLSAKGEEEKVGL